MIALMVALVAAGPVEDWLDTPPLQMDVELLRAMAAEAEPGRDLDILADHRIAAWDDQGRMRSTLHRVYRVNTADMASSWGYVFQQWSPWHQQPVTLAARVITPDGREVLFDPSTLVESSGEGNSSTDYSDHRQRSGPLPAMTAGAIVEEWVVTVSDPPLANVEDTGFYTTYDLPLQEHLYVTLAAPRRGDLLFHLDGAEVEPQSVRLGDLRGLRFDLGASVYDDDIPASLPRDVAYAPLLRASVGASWADVAASYREVVEPLVDVDAVASQLSEIRAEGLDREGKVRRALAHARDDVRYVAVELGENSIVPRPPASVLSHGYGDCKDKAVLLVSLLRGLGEEAYVTLINSGYGRDVDVEVPSVFAFDHAIVALREADGSFRYLDPTAEFTSVGELPGSDQGRRVLVAADGETALRMTPAARAEDHRWDKRYTVHLVDVGSSPVEETLEVSGRFASNLRSYTSDDAEGLAREFEDWARETFGGEPSVRGIEEDPVDLEQSQWSREVDWEAHSMTWGLGSESTIQVDIDDDALFLLPDLLFQADDRGTRLAERTVPVRLSAGSASVQLEVLTPEGYSATQLPSAVDRQIGGVHYAVAVDEQPGRTALTLDVSVEEGTLSVAEAVELRDFLLAREDRTVWALEWVDVLGRLNDEGRHFEAAQLATERLASDPTRHQAAVVLGAALLDSGFPSQAGQVAEALLDEQSDHAGASRIAAGAALRGPTGLHLAGGWDRTHALQVLDHAWELNPGHTWVAQQYATALSAQDGGAILVSDDLDRAIDILESIDTSNLPDGRALLLNALMYRGQFDRVLELTRSIQSDSERPIRLASLFAASGMDRVQSQRPEPIQLVAASVALGIRGKQEEFERLVRALPEGGPELYRMYRQTLLQAVDPLRPRRDPVHTYRQTLRDLLDGNEASTQFARWVDAESALDAYADALGLDPTLRLKALLMSPVEAEGSDEVGYRLMSRDNATQGPVAFVAPGRGGLRLLGLTNLHLVAARQALHELDAGRDDAARQWLTWAIELVGGPMADTGVVGLMDAQVMWNFGQPTSLEAVALVLLSDSATPDESRRMRALATELEPADALRLELASYMSADERDPAVFDGLTGLVQAHPEQPIVAASFMAAGMAQERPDITMEELQRTAEAQPRNLLLLAGAQDYWGDTSCIQTYDRARSLGVPVPPNEFAWALVVHAPERLAEARTLLNPVLQSEPSVSALHTAAVIELVAGDLPQAWAYREAALGLLEPGETLQPVWLPIEAALLKPLSLSTDAEAALAALDRGEMFPPLRNALGETERMVLGASR